MHDMTLRPQSLQTGLKHIFTKKKSWINYCLPYLWIYNFNSNEKYSDNNFPTWTNFKWIPQKISSWCLTQVCLQCLMTPCQRVSDVFEVIDFVNKLLEIIVLCFKPHHPVPDQWSSSETQRQVLVVHRLKSGDMF